MELNTLLQLLISGISMGAVYGLIALGYMSVFNSSGVINFAQGDYVMLGGLITAFLLHNIGLSYIYAAIIAMICTVIYGVLTGVLIIYPLKKASVLILVIATLGISTFTQNTASLIFGRYPLSLPPLIKMKSLDVFGAKVSPQNIFIIIISILILVLLSLITNHTMFGKAMQASSTDKLSAKLVGISPSTVVLASFAISAAVGSIGGIIIAPVFFTSYSVGPLLGLKGFVAGVIGGWGKTNGAFVGGLILGVIESLSVGFISSGYKDAVAFIVLIAILYFLPRGIFRSDVID
ncbi:MAG: branched-chain amino acid ABC transporter permease [Candidatus Humimicrobiaceae bacterium]